MDFLHHGIPMPTRRAVVRDGETPQRDTGVPPVRGGSSFGESQSSQAPDTRHGRDARVTAKQRLLKQLAHPNTASKHWVIRQYDHEVQGGSVIKPLIGPQQLGPSDAAVIRPKLDSYRGVSLACGLAPHIEDPYAMAIAAIDEAIRNVVAVGTSPSRVAILDNFCWPSVDSERSMGDLVRTCEACRDAALAYGIPFISGKDSLHNQFTNSETGEVIRIPNTLLISAIGVIEDVRKCVTMDLKDPREGMLLLLEPPDGSLQSLAVSHRAVAHVIRTGLVTAAHDVSEGGYLTAVAEMCVASGFGAKLKSEEDAERYFAEGNGRYVVETHYAARPALEKALSAAGVRVRELGRTSPDPALQVSRIAPQKSETFDVQAPIDELTKAWRGTLDW
jgi:phosphoribosylformylglycinamidine synthase